GLILAVAGGWLAALGGSLYYAAAGIALLAVGVLLLRGSPAALWLHAVLLAASLWWAVWEAGVDWWPLAARLDLLFLLGLWLLTPWVRRSLQRADGAAPAWGAGLAPARAVLGLALAVSAALAVLSWFRAPHELAGRLEGRPAADAAPEAAAPVPPGEWHAYGRTGEGQRHSPLAQITPANANQLRLAWEFRTGDRRGRPGDPEETTYEVTPLKIGNRLFLCTPHQSVIALDATTG